jgi:hypothetical protein
MQLSKAQQAILLAIESDPALKGHFEVLCAALEAALDEVAFDPERTEPFGAVTVASETAGSVEVTDASVVIGVAWLDAIAQAIEIEDGVMSRATLDQDGVPSFVDTRPLFEVAKACGYTAGQLRLVLAKVRQGERTAQQRAMRILADLGTLRAQKRRVFLLERSRVKPLSPGFAKNLDAGEIARAKAGSIFYTLVVQNGRYEAGRARKVPVRKDRQRRAEDLSLVSEANLDVISDFKLPFKSSDDAQQLAVEHFVSFLAEKGYTYQRLVYRAAA